MSISAVSAVGSAAGIASIAKLVAASTASQELQSIDPSAGAASDVVSALSTAFDKLLADLGDSQTPAASAAAIQSLVGNSVQSLGNLVDTTA